MRDAHEDIDTDTDGEGHVTAILTASLTIFRLVCHIPLQQSPFLAHWVNIAAKIQRTLPLDFIPWHWKVRLEIIRLALCSPGVEAGLAVRGSANMMKMSPESIVGKISNESVRLIQLRPFYEMMVKQGLPISTELASYLEIEQCRIGEEEDGRNMPHVTDSNEQKDLMQDLLARATRSVQHSRTTSQQTNEVPSSSELDEDAATPAMDTLSANAKGKSAIDTSLFPITSRSSLNSIQEALKVDPVEAAHCLTRLPVDLPSLDLLTKVVESDVLPNVYVDPAAVTREYILHSLRVVERIGNVLSPSSDTGNFEGTSADAMDDPHLPRGRDEQVRAIKLLIMFMRNLLKKDKLPVHELSYDIHGLCTQYIWIPEVRDFKNFLEGADLGLADLDAPMTTAGG